MPEDARPKLPSGSAALVHYLSFPMALNYQRNSYALWEAATKTYQDSETNFVFDPLKVATKSPDELRSALQKYKVALQPNRHVNTWWTISNTVADYFEGDIRKLFDSHANDVHKVLSHVRANKKLFPCLCGNKIGNYWLYVIHLYSGYEMMGLENLSVAPDTHVIQASVQLGLIEDSQSKAEMPNVVANAWTDLLVDTEYRPIDIHTPLWLWSRAGFPNGYGE
jgi:hypothetical protein